MLYRPQKTRRYRYRPQFYKEQEDRGETGPRIKFRKSFSRPKTKKSYILFLLLLFIVLFISNYLSSFLPDAPTDMNIGEMEVVR